MLKGRIKVDIEDESCIGVPNSAIFIPRNRRHALHVLDEKTELLVITAPPAH